MTTQELYNAAVEITKEHGFENLMVNAHAACSQWGKTCSISIMGSGKHISTQIHKSAFKALFELNTLLTELKAKSCIVDNPNP